MIVTDQHRENRKKWVAALRSGEFDQAIGKLESEDGRFCCLGVACRLANLPREIHASYVIYGDPGDHEHNYLPTGGAEWLGLETSNPSVLIKELNWQYLANLNDEGYSFAEIADLIEAQDDDWTGYPSWRRTERSG